MHYFDDLDKKISDLRQKISTLNQSDEKNEFLEKINAISIDIDHLKAQNTSPTEVVKKQPLYKSTELTMGLLGVGMTLTALTGGAGGVGFLAGLGVLNTLANIVGWVMNIGGLMMSSVQAIDFSYQITQDMFNNKQSIKKLDILEKIDSLTQHVEKIESLEKKGQEKVVTNSAPSSSDTSKEIDTSDPNISSQTKYESRKLKF